MGPHRTCRSAGALLVLLLVAAAGPQSASANVSTWTKTCVDVNGGSVCENDWIRCTLHLEVSQTQEVLAIFDPIPSSMYKQWRRIQSPPPPANNMSLREGQNPMAGPGAYWFTAVIMNPGAQYDFIYEAQVKGLAYGTNYCGTGEASNENLQSWLTNSECVTFNCAPPNAALTLTTKTWTGPNPVVVGTPITFTITVTNAGTAADTNVRVTDTLDPARYSPPTVGYSRAPTTGGLAGQTLDATWNTLAVGEVITITLDTVYANCVIPGMDGACNQATIRSTSISAQETSMQRLSDDPSTGRANDSTCRFATGGGWANIVAPPPKTMVDVNGGQVLVGDRVRVVVTLTNTNPCPGTAAYFEDTIPVGLTYVPGSIVVTPASGTTGYTAGTRLVWADNFTVPGGSLTIQFDMDVAVAPVDQVCNTGRYRIGLSNLLPTTTACIGRLDTDGDTIADDGDGDGTAGNNKCTGGATANCDDNCPSTPNPMQQDTDGDRVGNACDNCPTVVNATQIDNDSDGAGDSGDACPGFDDSLDADMDGVPDGCDACPGFDDLADADADGVPDGCDVCAGFDDLPDADMDLVPDGCDVCTGFDDALDMDGDGVPDGCDACPGFDDGADADSDAVPDGCDACPGSNDGLDTDMDLVPDGCDNCVTVANGPAGDDQANRDLDALGDACDPCPDDPFDTCSLLSLLRNAEITSLRGAVGLYSSIFAPPPSDPSLDPALPPAGDFLIDVSAVTLAVAPGDAQVVGLGMPGVLIFYEVEGATGPITVRKSATDVVLTGW